MTRLELANCEQGSELWQSGRIGLVTASRAGDATAKLKRGGEAAARASYRSELICEILTGQPYPRYISAEMQWGIDQEPFARAAYELERDVLVETCGFILHPKIDRLGASPDGLVGKDGLIQIKCPTTSTHLAWMLAGAIPLEHMPQMLAEMSCTGRNWCDFVSYDPRLPGHLQLFVRRFTRHQQFIDILECEVKQLNDEIDEVLAALSRQEGQPITKVLDMPIRDEVDVAGD